MSATEASGKPPGPSDSLQSFQGAGRLYRALIAQAPSQFAVAFFLLLTAGVTEAFGLVMIIPLLYASGLAGPADPQSPVIEAVAATGVQLTLPAVLGVFVFLAVVRSGVAWQRNQLVSRIRLEFIDRFREELYTSIAEAKWGVLVRQRQSDLLHVLFNDVNRTGQGAFLLLQLTVSSVLALAQLIVAVLISPLVFMVALLAGGLLALLIRPLIERANVLGEQLTGANKVVHGLVTDFLGGLKLAKGFNAEAPHIQHFTDAIADKRERNLAFTRTSSLAQAAISVGAAIALAGIVWWSFSDIESNLPELLVVALIFARVLQALSRLQRDAQQLAHVMPAYTHARTIRQELQRAAEMKCGWNKEPFKLNRSLKVRNVSFVYDPNAGKPALMGINLALPAQGLIVVAGPSGAGKSTLADILLGLLEPGNGEVRVDDALLTGPNLRRWRRCTGYVPQDPYLFNDSIRANLLWARPSASEREIRWALGLAAAEEFITGLPQGLETVVGDRGSRLSGGERQRIALARALIGRPALLVLDEVTAHVDAGTERRIVAALESLRERMLVVALTHRPALLRAADYIVLLESGRVAATGTRGEAPELFPTPDAN